MTLKTMKDVEIAMKAGTIRTFAEQNASLVVERSALTQDERDARVIYIKHVLKIEEK